MQNNDKEEIAFLSHKILDLNKKLIESEKMKSQFLSLVASKLNNPMTALLGLIPHLDPDKSCSKKIFHTVRQETLHLYFQIQNLVAAAEIEGGAVQLDYAIVTVGAILEDVLKDLQYELDAKSVAVALCDTLRTPVTTDPKKLYLILKNLIANGCAYGLEGGLISVCITQNESNLRIDVTNQGTGPEVACKLEVFQRFAETPEGKHGLGIGLSVARELCIYLDGALDYEVNNETTTFHVTLPLETVVAKSDAYGSNEFLFESFDDVIEM